MPEHEKTLYSVHALQEQLDLGRSVGHATQPGLQSLRSGMADHAGSGPEEEQKGDLGILELPG